MGSSWARAGRGSNTEIRQSTFQDVSALVPRLLRFYMWGYGRKTPLIWHGQLVGSSGTGVKRGNPAGILDFAVSTHSLFCSICDAIERVATEYFPLLPSFVGVTAICDELQVVSDPQLALPVAEVVQRKILESGRSLINIAKCRILVHPDSAHLVEWPPQWRPGLCAALPIETDGAKLLEAPIGTEPFRTDFVELRSSKACASVPSLRWNTCHPQLPGRTILRYCVNERVNFPSSKTHSLAWTRLWITPFSALEASRPRPRPPDSPLSAPSPLNWVVWSFGGTAGSRGKQRVCAGVHTQKWRRNKHCAERSG